MRKSKILLFLFIYYFLFNIQSSIIAADKKEDIKKGIKGDIKVLVLTNKKNGKTKQIKAGKKIVFWTKDGKKVKGRIENVSDSTIVVKNKEYNVSDIKVVRVTYLATKITGGFIGAVGLYGSVGGLTIFIQNLGQSGCDAGISRIIGVFLAIIGFGILSVGVLIFSIGKRHTQKKWTFSTAQIAE